MTDFDLRVFRFDWFPRKVHLGRTEQKRMPASLTRFFAHLAEHAGLVCPWAKATLADRDAYHERIESAPGPFCREGSMAWRGELHRDLDRRLLMHDEDLDENLCLGESPGRDEFTLEQELQRRWLLWYDEQVREGQTDPLRLRPLVLERQPAWAHRAHPDVGKRSPLKVIRAERKRTKPPPGFLADPR